MLSSNDKENWPRERILRGDLDKLSDGELLAVLLRTGLPRESVLAMSERIINEYGGLCGLVNLPLAELQAIRGLGKAKGVIIAATMEIARRVLSGAEKRLKINSPQDAFLTLRPLIALQDKEVLYAILLSVKNQILAVRRISEGSLNSTLVHPREVYRAALNFGAAALIVGHNHPSGDCTPSTDDLAVTTKLKAAGDIIGIKLLDHLIVTGDKYYSFEEHGKI